MCAVSLYLLYIYSFCFCNCETIELIRLWIRPVYCLHIQVSLTSINYMRCTVHLPYRVVTLLQLVDVEENQTHDLDGTLLVLPCSIGKGIVIILWFFFFFPEHLRLYVHEFRCSRTVNLRKSFGFCSFKKWNQFWIVCCRNES